MIFLGAGASYPFGIPGMEGFHQDFKEEVVEERIVEKKSPKAKEIQTLYSWIEQSIEESEKRIGYDLEADLESVMAVLEDISGRGEGEPFSYPTASFLSHEFEEERIDGFSLQEAGSSYQEVADRLLEEMKRYIFERCVKPVSGNNLDKFYSPIFCLLLRNGISRLFSGSSENVFTTNWDLSFERWASYRNVRLTRGTKLDN